MTQRPRVAILGGGMAGMATAWRLSEPGWQDRFDAITVYQRGWRLGGKGASSRGAHGRIEEHGLHIWLGYYENAFRLLRECYAELDRPTTDPDARIKTWRDAIIPATEVGLEERRADGWHHWIGDFRANDQLPGEPDAAGGVMSVVELVERCLGLIVDFTSSLPSREGTVALSASPAPPPVDASPLASGVALAALAVVLEAASVGRQLLGGEASPNVAVSAIDTALASIRTVLADAAAADEGLQRTWHLLSVCAAIVRGVLAEGLLTDPRGFSAINDVEFRTWIARHGCAPEACESTLIMGLYDLVFGHRAGDHDDPGFGAGLGVFLSSKTFLDYKGAIFWKMTAGMGDVVFAPMYEVLRRRGVDFELLHRVDALHVSDDRATIDTITVGVQARLAPGVERYEPLVRVRGLPCFPDRPLVDQLADADGIEDAALESHWSAWPDAERRVLRRGVDFDIAVLAVPVAMAELVCEELVTDRPEWKAMVEGVATVATQAFQIWLREDEPTLGWDRPGSTISGYVSPFDTWASMPQTIDAEAWPDGDRPRSIHYFCNTLAAPWPPDRPGHDYTAHWHEQVRANAVRFLDRDVAHLLPGAVDNGGFRWNLLCGSEPGSGPGAFATQFSVANVDPSDRYVQSLPGTDTYRLRPDESGYDNLFLAGDWTDCGLNAGCIEAAVLSGLRAANAIMGKSRRWRIAGTYMS
jgi:uncharacterized protein with NAD-binding domain and iron-sulfur cluster